MAEPHADLNPGLNFASACGCNEQRGRTCFKHKLRSIQFGGVKKSPQTLMEAQWHRDMPAYQRLRRNGLQPPQINGSAKLEATANSQLEIEMGDLVDQCVAADSGGDSKQTRRKLLPKIAEGMAVARDLDWNPTNSVEDHKERNVRPYREHGHIQENPPE
jgi:hypothetical protein